MTFYHPLSRVDNVTLRIYHCRVARFNSVDHLSIFFPRNYGAEQTKVYYIGLKGDFTEVIRNETWQIKTPVKF